MKPDHRTAFIDVVRRSLGRNAEDTAQRRMDLFAKGPDSSFRQRVQRIKSRSREDRECLLHILMGEARPLNLQVAPVENLAEAAQCIASLAAEKSPEWGSEKSLVRWSHPLLDAMDLESALADHKIPVHTTRMDPDRNAKARKKAIRENIIASFIGVTSADYCLADTATIVMKSRPHQARAVSIVPSIHIAVIQLNQLLADLTELYTILEFEKEEKNQRLPHHLVLVSGPSKTADIELTMVHGAHGPREMHLLVIR